MSLYTIQVDDEAVHKMLDQIINYEFKNELANRYSPTGKEISQAVKELIYANKEEIIKRVVKKASIEIVKKGLPKLLSKFEEENDDIS